METLEEIFYKNVKIYNWLEYINEKFKDTSIYEIIVEDYHILVQSKVNDTQIFFFCKDNFYLKIDDCQYYNNSCRGWSGETIAENSNIYGTFTQENINRTDDILNTPIYKGWISEDYYINNEFYKSVTFFDQDRTQPTFHYHGSKYGCIIFLIYPLFLSINYLLKNGYIGTKEIIVVSPIEKSKRI